MRAFRNFRSIQLLNFLVLSLMVVTLAYAETPLPDRAPPKPCGPPPMSVPPKTKDTLVSELGVPEPSPSKPTTSAMTPPQLVYSVDPMFPSGLSNSALAAGAIVVVTLTVDEEGKPQQAHVVCSSNPAFVANAIKAVKQYRFKPARLKGKPVPVEVNVETNFRVPDSP